MLGYHLLIKRHENQIIHHCCQLMLRGLCHQAGLQTQWKKLGKNPGCESGWWSSGHSHKHGYAGLQGAVPSTCVPLCPWASPEEEVHVGFPTAAALLPPWQQPLQLLSRTQQLPSKQVLTPKHLKLKARALYPPVVCYEGLQHKWEPFSSAIKK